jgi:hypothetical protein
MRKDFERAEARAHAGDYDGAARRYRKVLAAVPHMGAHHNLANMLVKLGRWDEAERHYRDALSLDPQFAPAQYALGGLLASAGDLNAGFAAMECRFCLPGRARTVPAPRWHGQRLNGEAVMVHAEQGFGDTIMMARYLPLIAERGGRPVFAGPPALHRLVARIPGVHVAATFDQLPRRYLECPTMSLPVAFGTDLTNIPPAPYLTGDPRPWADVLAAMPGLKVGLCWAGRSNMLRREETAMDAGRSLRLKQLLPILQVPGCSFVSLQLGPPAAQLADVPPGLVLDVSDRLTDWAATAGLIEGLDLVISVDTGVAHLAGALGRPVWMLDRYAHCWRWLRGRSDSPWYPTMRIFRQPRSGNWAAVIAGVRNSLSTR